MSYALLDDANNIVPISKSVIENIPKLNSFFSLDENKHKVYKLEYSTDVITSAMTFIENYNNKNNNNVEMTPIVINLLTFLELNNIVDQYINQKNDEESKYDKYLDNAGIAVVISKNMIFDSSSKYRKSKIEFEKLGYIEVTQDGKLTKFNNQIDYTKHLKKFKINDPEIIARSCPFELIKTETFYVGNFVKTREHFEINKQIFDVIIDIFSKAMLKNTAHSSGLKQYNNILEKYIDYDNYTFKLVMYATWDFFNFANINDNQREINDVLSIAHNY